jgi:hypothetical protein
MANIDPFLVQMTRNYTANEWREDATNLMQQCGAQDLTTCLLITDAQIVGNFQLEDLSNLLVNGEIPDLFEQEEIEKVKLSMGDSDLFGDEVPWRFFVTRAKRNLHIIMVFSPFGPVFLQSLRCFPALRSETTIDWFMPWSSDALENVGRVSLNCISIGDVESVNAIVNVDVKIHKSVEDASSKFLAEAKRFTACTPSRYFERLTSFMARLTET